MAFTQWLETVVFVLGAADPEMNRIEAVLAGIGARTIHAAFSGADGSVARCHGGVAYKATHLLEAGAVLAPADVVMSYIRDTHTPVWVECGIPGISRDPQHSYVLDHHNPGDPGHGGAPAAYWESSSLGQLWALLLGHGLDAVTAALLFGEDARMLAASDHCPSHAFQGKCPGIDVAALRAMRRANAAAFQKKDIASFDLEVDAAVAALLECPVAKLGDFEYRIAFDPIPQLNHAQLEAGLPVQYVTPGNARDPRTKVGLLGGEPALIKLWMEEKSLTLDDIYGDPERGYAGGYLPQR